MPAPITPQQYIAWVQRSLNRLIGASLMTNGDDTAEYRNKVLAFKSKPDFKSKYGLGSSSEVGVPEHNALIKENNAARDYVTWVQTALEKAGVGAGGAPSGRIDSTTRTAIRSFQAFEGLLDDGWIGPKTETVLIGRSGEFPPGHRGRPSDKPEEPREEIKTGVTVRPRVPAMWGGTGPRCWAGSFAMMYAWKRSHKPIRDVLDEAGGGYTRQYNASVGLDDYEMEDLAERLGLTGESEVPNNWVAKLRDHGPLMLAQDSGAPGWLHWIVVIGYQKTSVFPDRTQDQEHLKYNDPFQGFSGLKDLDLAVRKAKATTCRYRWYHY